MKNFRLLRIAPLLLVWMFAQTPVIEAQCPMCRMSAESNLKNGGTSGRGLNTGIIYLLVMPYLIVPSLLYLWWRNRKQAQRYEENLALQEMLEDTAVSLSEK